MLPSFDPIAMHITNATTYNNVDKFSKVLFISLILVNKLIAVDKIFAFEVRTRQRPVTIKEAGEKFWMTSTSILH